MRKSRRDWRATPTLPFGAPWCWTDDGVDLPPSKDGDGRKFIAFDNRGVLLGVGHNVSQEAPTSFADTIRELHERD